MAASASTTSSRITSRSSPDEVGQHLLGGGQVVGALPEIAGPRHDRIELLVPAGQLGVARLVGEHVRVGQTSLDVGELVLQ